MLSISQRPYRSNNESHVNLSPGNVQFTRQNKSLNPIRHIAANSLSLLQAPSPSPSCPIMNILEASAPPEILHKDNFERPPVLVPQKLLNEVKGPCRIDDLEEVEGPEEVDDAEGPEIMEDIEGPDDVEVGVGPEEQIPHVFNAQYSFEVPDGPSIRNNPLFHNAKAYRYAKLYTTKADAGMRISRNAIDATGRFVRAFSNSTVRAWNLGGKRLAKEILEESVGIRHYNDALNTIKQSWAGQIPSRLDVNQRMGIPEALGEASSHCAQGITKGVLTSTAVAGASLYVAGTVSNAFLYTPASYISLHMAASVLAAGVNGAGKIALTVASHTVVRVVRSAITNPMMAARVIEGSARLGLVGAGMATGLYYASTNYAKFVDTPGFSNKFKHGVLTAASLSATIAVPFFTAIVG